MNYWLVKSEPETYSWDDFVKLGRDHWDGVRNYQARNNLKEMNVGDEVLFYHSGKERQVVGLAKVVKEHYPDPTTDDPQWVVVDLVPVKKLNRHVTLAEVKDEEKLSQIHLVRNARLSVMPLKKEEFELLMQMGS